MKSISLYFFGLCCCLLIACKKDKDTPIPQVTGSLQICSVKSKTEGMYVGTDITRFTYSADDKLLKEEVFNELDSLTAYTIYEYDGDKKAKAELYWTNGGTQAPYVAFTTLYEYDANGNLSRSSTTGLSCYFTNYEYTGTLLAKESSFSCIFGANTLNYYTEYEYDAEGRKITETLFDSNGNLSHGYKYEYKDGRLNKRFVFHEPNDINFDFEYIYDNKGNLIQELSSTYTYDEFNRLITAVIGGIDTVETRTYEYCE